MSVRCGGWKFSGQKKEEETWIEIPEEFIISSVKSPIEEIVKETFPDFATKKRPTVTYNSADEVCKASTDTLDQQHLYLLELLGETISQEDVNQKLLKSLSSEWNTHVVVWRNKSELETISMDDLYNNLKVYEIEVKGMSSSSSSIQNIAFVSSSNNNSASSNEAVNTAQTVNTAYGVSTASTQVNTTNSLNADNLRDVVIYTFLASQPNSPQLNRESTRRNIPVETSTSTALVSCDSLGGYDWSDQAEEGPNYALMAYSSSSSDSEKSKLMALAYKTGLESVEEKLEVYKANESIYSQDIKVLKFEIEFKGIAIRELRKKLEIAQKEKDSIQFNVDKFENASKSFDKLIECSIIDNCKKGLGYNAVLPPYIGNFMPPTPDLSFTGLDEFVNKLVVENKKSDKEVSKVVRKSNDSLIIKD
ncbi:hypothetical protein Tco_0730342 [Tanacetum coccineum]|uniref:Uncharacterized protein n=1 Tax=Tanacetum coccineum TaxID=301880 RepID=A0ABQ4YTY2_9ASTR